MTPARLIGSLVLVATTAATWVHAQTPPYTATVKDAEAEVRSGPSNDPKMYATNRLRKGDLVEVVKVYDANWLAIKPPTGSFSWINTKFVDKSDKNSQTYVVVTHAEYPVPVRIGSSVLDKEPTVEGVRVARGSLVVAVGATLPSQTEGMWLPIEPPPTEVRYIRSDVVQTTKVSEPPIAPVPVAGGGTVSGGGSGGSSPAPVVPAPAGVSLGGSGGSAQPTTTTSNSPGATTPIASTPPADPTSPEGMWYQAEQLEKAGRLKDAESLYANLAHLCNNPKYHDLAMKCYNRINYMREGLNKAKAVGTGLATTLISNQKPNGGTDPRFSPIPTTYSKPVVEGNLTANSGSAQTTGFGGPAVPAATLEPQNYGPGLLRISGRTVDGQRAYALEDNRGQLLTYVTTQPGTSLDSYVNRVVNLHGPMIYDGNLKNNHMKVQSIQIVP